MPHSLPFDDDVLAFGAAGDVPEHADAVLAGANDARARLKRDTVGEDGGGSELASAAAATSTRGSRAVSRAQDPAVTGQEHGPVWARGSTARIAVPFGTLKRSLSFSAQP